MKSPVRENCTPGSVRGLSGDWQSYRDPARPLPQAVTDSPVIYFALKPISILRIIRLHVRTFEVAFDQAQEGCD